MSVNIEEKDLQVLLTLMDEAIMIFEDSGVASYANPKAHELLGFPGLKGMKLEDISKDLVNEDGSQYQLAESSVLVALETGKSPPERTYKSNLTQRWMSGSSSPIIEHGKSNRVFVLFHDVTDLKNSEISKEKLIQDREKFYEMISHDLKNPLTAINLAANLIRKNSPDLPLTRKHIETILNCTAFMSHLIDELLKISSIQSKKMKLKYEDINLSEVLASLEKYFELQLEIKRLSLKMQSVNLTCQCDRERLLQVLMNLIGNAIKFSKEGGEVSVDIKSSNSHFLISVKDCGPGIPSDQISKIFEPYYQITKEDTYKGHGLGLTIVKHIVEAHRGRVWAESREGTGSSFHVMLPKSKDVYGT